MGRRLKLAILIYSLAGGGAERVVSILLEELFGKFDISLVLLSPVIDYEIPENVKIYFLEKSNPFESGFVKLFKLPLLAVKYRNFCRKNKIDISLSFMNRPSYISILSKILFGNNIPILISERATPSKIYGSNTILARTNRFLVRRLYPFSDHIISNSNGNRFDLESNFQVSNRLLSTIHNPINLSLVELNSSFQVELPGDDNSFTCISVGRLDEGKNHKLLIDVFSLLPASIKARLIILGEGPLKADLISNIRELSLEDRVFLVGFDSNPFRWMNRSDCFLFASSFEGFPNVLIEAMACGLPIISTDCPCGPREILCPESDPRHALERGEECASYGILVPVGDVEAFVNALTLMINNSDLRARYRKRSLERVACYDSHEIAKRYEEKIVSCISS